jgi:hypothetical protein
LGEGFDAIEKHSVAGTGKSTSNSEGLICIGLPSSKAAGGGNPPYWLPTGFSSRTLTLGDVISGEGLVGPDGAGVPVQAPLPVFGTVARSCSDKAAEATIKRIALHRLILMLPLARLHHLIE